MLLTTTGTIEGHQIERYLGIVSSEVVLGANAIKDMMAGFRADLFRQWRARAGNRAK